MNVANQRPTMVSESGVTETRARNRGVRVRRRPGVVFNAQIDSLKMRTHRKLLLQHEGLRQRTHATLGCLGEKLDWRAQRVNVGNWPRDEADCGVQLAICGFLRRVLRSELRHSIALRLGTERMVVVLRVRHRVPRDFTIGEGATHMDGSGREHGMVGLTFNRVRF